MRERIEVLGNIFVRLGLTAMAARDTSLPEVITPGNLLEIVTQYKKQHGETLEGALAMQGITLMLWLEK